MRKRYKIPLIIFGIIVGLPLIFIALFQIDHMLKQPSIPEPSSLTLFSLSKSKHIEFLTEGNW